MHEYEDLRKLEKKVDRGWDSDRKFVEYIEERLRAMELTHKDLRDKIEKLEKRVSPLEICINAHKDLYDNTRKIEKLGVLFGVMKKTYNNSFKQIKELERKIQYSAWYFQHIQDWKFKWFNHLHDKQKELEKKLEGEPILGPNYPNGQATFPYYGKEEQEAIDIVEDYRKNREKYEGKEAEPDKIAGVHQECPECGWKFYGYFRYGKQLITEFIKDLKSIEIGKNLHGNMESQIKDIREKWEVRKEGGSK